MKKWKVKSVALGVVSKILKMQYEVSKSILLIYVNGYLA